MTSVFSSATSAAAAQLRTHFSGRLLIASDSTYAAARAVWNGAVEHQPAVIAQCADDRDVSLAVQTARQFDIPLSVRGGGHDWAGRALRHGGLVVDLSHMRKVSIDAAGETALVQGGALTGDVLELARPYNLVAVSGTIKAVGLAGLTLAGGYGPLNGKHGLALDNLVAADVVLANGDRVLASQHADADLWWALRGGGGNFGVVTSFRYRLHPLEQVLAGIILYPISEAATVLRAYREVIATAPDELTLMTGFLGTPEGPLLFMCPTWSGDRSRGEPIVEGLTRLGTPVSAQLGPMAYADALGLFDASVANGRHHFLRARWLAELTDDAAALLVEAARQATSPFSLIALHHFHGVAARVPLQATVFGLRQPHLLVEILAAWDGDSAPHNGSRHRQWAESLSSRLAAHALPGGYPNLLGPDEVDRIELAYGVNLPRLRQLKRRYDPDNVFSSAIGSFAEVRSADLAKNSAN
jgi:FAD/FMN-containing dehydrogenase